MEDRSRYPIIGQCSICFEGATIQSCGETLCLKHAKEWKFGYGKSLMQMHNESFPDDPIKYGTQISR